MRKMNLPNGEKSMKIKYILSVLILSLCSFTARAGGGPLPVVAVADQAKLLASTDAKLAFNKKLVYDFDRIILNGRRLERTSEFMSKDYIQHNPNVPTGMDGFLKFFSQLGGPRDIPATVPDLVSIQAEGDIVTLSFVNELQDPSNPNQKYTTTWFDMFRVKDGKIAEHWDCDVKSAPSK
jgi:predicted SnoaL-like aldol condensation-catalyzing enzyme